MSITQIHPALAGKIRERLKKWDEGVLPTSQFGMLVRALRAEVDAAERDLGPQPVVDAPFRQIAEIQRKMFALRAEDTLQRIAANLGIATDK